MNDAYAVAVEGLGALGALDTLPADIVKAARLAVNATTRLARTKSARSMERQINFPGGYLTGQNGRLSISKYATGTDLEGIVTGGDRATSLARFVSGGAKLGTGKGVYVEVKPGLATFMPGAFVIRLRNNNLGLAVRTKNARPPSAGAKLVGRNLFILYGPSVDQVFNETRNMIRPEMEAYMEQEFNRVFGLNL